MFWIIYLLFSELRVISGGHCLWYDLLLTFPGIVAFSYITTHVGLNNLI